ncbi:MAG TPA: electron transfer flavoprotein subunit alpha/FixB family protein [Longimicrobiales bacterium]|nr:electron transfer flavoprotein subunit alpha/FixB family protein [Longimicrobiales bacterium]
MANILAVAEQRDGALRRISEEVVSAAKTLAGSTGGAVHAALLGGSGTRTAAAALAGFGADTIHVAESDEFTNYSPEGYVDTLAALIRDGGYFAVLIGGSALGKDLAPRLAARLDLPLASDATALDVDGGELVVTRPVYAGRAFAQVILQAEPRLVSLRPNVFRAEARPGSGSVVELAVSGDAGARRVRVREVRAAQAGRLDVGEAPIVVSGGRGLRDAEHWHLLESLRDALGPGCALGASRAVVDAGWRPHAEQVGQTGKTVSPQLYFAVGISGAMQHLAGMRSARTIVAINKDPDAPIFKIADYGLVGDAHEVLPKLTEEIRKLTGC